jgi:hypothetical protein
MVPGSPTPPGAARHLLRLAAVSVDNYSRIRVCGLRQAVGIGVLVGEREQPQYPVEIDQTSPFWSFVDGNISWHLRFIAGATLNMTPNIHRSSAGVSVDYTGTDASLLLDNQGIFPPANGQPPGKPVGPLGTIRDIRYPWYAGENSALDFEIDGPGVLGLYASVKQTDPRTRLQLGPLLGPNVDTSVLSREDQFLLQFPDAIYRHVSGAILCSFGQISRRPGADPVQGETPP